MYYWHTARLASPNEPDDTDHTGEIISFSDVGSGVGTNPPVWYCYTYDSGGAVWQGPGGSTLPIADWPRDAVGEELFISGRSGAVVLHCGPAHFSPDGEHCCVRLNTNPNLRRCVTFSECCMAIYLCPILTPTPTAPCPTLSPLTNGRISYDAATSVATYTCNTGYNIIGATPITCGSDGTSAGTWSPTPPTACAREYCTVF